MKCPHSVHTQVTFGGSQLLNEFQLTDFLKFNCIFCYYTIAIYILKSHRTVAFCIYKLLTLCNRVMTGITGVTIHLNAINAVAATPPALRLMF